MEKLERVGLERGNNIMVSKMRKISDIYAKMCLDRLEIKEVMLGGTADNCNLSHLRAKIEILDKYIDLICRVLQD